ncbi:MAG: twin-arginine translocase subunit TatC [Clostridia bacterium]|nr:twin-arginine translocase subunit TatC [Clostridia bacterium]
MDEKNMSIIEHLAELRKVLIVSIVAILVGGFICFFAWGDLLFEIVTAPLEEFDVSLVYISMPEAFLTKVKISLVAGVVLVSPIVFWQIWSYIVPALHQNEKRIILTLLPASLVLFVAGILFAYFTVFRFAAGFLLMIAGDGLQAMISVSRYVSFLLTFLLPFGIIFQLPLVILFLTRIGVITSAKLATYRKYVIVLSFVVAAVLTPPDVISQVFMAGSLIILYEASFLISKLVKPKVIDYDDDLVESHESK